VPATEVAECAIKKSPEVGHPTDAYVDQLYLSSITALSFQFRVNDASHISLFFTVRTRHPDEPDASKLTRVVLEPLCKFPAIVVALPGQINLRKKRPKVTEPRSNEPRQARKSAPLQTRP
jgi:hypothetical protein